MTNDVDQTQVVCASVSSLGLGLGLWLDEV